jgi:hypothetical protein
MPQSCLRRSKFKGEEGRQENLGESGIILSCFIGMDLRQEIGLSSGTPPSKIAKLRHPVDSDRTQETRGFGDAEYMHAWLCVK